MNVLLCSFLLLFALLPAVAFCAVPPGFGITGTWHGADNYWTVSPERLRMVAPGDKIGREYTVICAESLPADEWTISYSTVQNYDIAEATVTLSIGDPTHAFEVSIDPDNNRAEVSAHQFSGTNYDSFAGGYMEGCGGFIHQVRIMYSAKQRRFEMRINGQPVHIQKVPSELPTGPIQIRMKLPNGMSKEFCADIVDFHMLHNAVFTDDTHTFAGQAWKGWTAISKPAASDVPVQFLSDMAALYQNPSLTDLSRACLLASVVLYERAQSGHINTNAWTMISDLTDRANKQADKYNKDYGLSFLYPLAVASADPIQREQAQTWTAGYYNTLTSLRYNLPERISNMRRSVLLDPQLTITAAIAQSPGSALYNALIHDVSIKEVDDKVAFYTGMISSDSFPLNAYAWLLPELEQASPSFAACVKSMFCEFAIRRDSLFQQDIDIPLAFASYRIAPTDLSLAMSLAETIRDDGTLADLYEAIQALPVGTQIPDLPVRIEKALLGYIAQWKKSRNNASPVQRYVRLANWYLAQQRNAEATATVKEATPKITTDDKLGRFRDLRLIATFYKTIKAPEEAEWTAKMNEAATVADTGLLDRADGWVSIAATNGTVRTLVQEGKIDDALAMIEKLDAEALPENIANCYAIVIYKLAKTDMPRALEILKKVPHVRQLDSIIAGIARYLTVAQARTLLQTAEDGRQKTAILGAVVPTIAKASMPEALALLKAMPPADRRTALFGIADATPLNSIPELLTLTNECITAYLGETKHYGRSTRMVFFNNLAEQSPATLMALEPSFANDYEFYSRVMVFSIAKACGLKEDPLWQRFAGVEWEYIATPIDWDCMIFKEAVSQYNEAQKIK